MVAQLQQRVEPFPGSSLPSPRPHHSECGPFVRMTCSFVSSTLTDRGSISLPLGPLPGEKMCKRLLCTSVVLYTLYSLLCCISTLFSALECKLDRLAAATGLKYDNYDGWGLMLSGFPCARSRSANVRFWNRNETRDLIHDLRA